MSTSQRIVVDPVTRIEGHLRIEAETDASGKITNAYSAGTMVRGIEIILRGRDPRDAWAFAQRICGVCTLVHGMASVRSVEDALHRSIPTYSIPRNAELIRNLMIAAQYVHDHVMHFYHLHAFDWVDVVSALKADPKATSALAQSISNYSKSSPGYFADVQKRVKTFVEQGQLGIFGNAYWGHSAYKLPPEANLMAVAHYLEALAWQRDVVKLHAIFGGKNPHPNFVVGGVPSAISAAAGRVPARAARKRASMHRHRAREQQSLQASRRRIPMKTNTRSFRATALALAVLGTLAAGQAAASGFQLREQSVKNLGKSNAGSIVGKDASNAALNPAAMTNLDKNTVQSDITVIDLSADFSGSGRILGSPHPSAGLTGGNGGDPGDPTVVPNMAAVFPMQGALEGMTLGFAVGAPFGLKTEYEPGWVGRYRALTSDVKVVDLTLSAAFQASDGVSIGLGMIYERADVTLSKAIDFGTAICASGNPANCFNPLYPFRPQQLDGAFEVNGNDTAIGYVVGAQIAPNDKLAIGFSHRSEIRHNLAGNLDFQNVPALLGTDPRFQDGPGGATMVTPTITTLSISYGINDDLRVLADYQATGWSSLRDVTIKRASGSVVGSEDFSWQDTDFFSLGVEYDLNEAFTLRAGVGSDESPTNDATRTPRLPDDDRMLYSIGMSWAMSDHLTIDAAYQRITIEDPEINLGVHLPSDLSTLQGTYSGSANLFGVSMQYRF